MKNERKIAIAIGSKFRNAMDKTMQPPSLSEEELMNIVSDNIDIHCNSLAPLEMTKDIPEDFLKAFKDIVFQTRIELYQAQQSIYDKMLPTVISDAMYGLEEYFRTNYSDIELEEIANFITTDVGKKLIADDGIFNILHEQRDRMRKTLNEEIDNNEATERMNKEISNLLVTLVFKRSDENDHDEDHEW